MEEKISAKINCKGSPPTQKRGILDDLLFPISAKTDYHKIFMPARFRPEHR